MLVAVILLTRRIHSGGVENLLEIDEFVHRAKQLPRAKPVAHANNAMPDTKPFCYGHPRTPQVINLSNLWSSNDATLAFKVNRPVKEKGLTEKRLSK